MQSSMHCILLATTNDRKLSEAQAACQDFGIVVEQVELQIDEIQARDAQKISVHKAAEAFRQVQKPVVVTDTSWSIPALHGFPGAYMKDVAEWFTPTDFIHLMSDKTDRRISFTENITYADGKIIRTFSQEFWGQITMSPRGSGVSIEQVVEFLVKKEVAGVAWLSPARAVRRQVNSSNERNP